MLPPLTINRVAFDPPLFLAPMAGIGHSAFRRLVADFGGYGALCTEMLAAKPLLTEQYATSPYVRRRPEEGKVIYQLLVDDVDRLEAIVGHLVARAAPDGIDINCACPAPDARFTGRGGKLFEDAPRLARVLQTVRRHWPGLLTVKIRLGTNTDGWRERLAERLHLCEDCGVDAVICHPRFADEKLKRNARHALFPWLASLTRLPLIASGDITGPETLLAHPEHFADVRGIMLGRIAIARPWVFAAWSGQPVAADYGEAWERLYRYVLEDFPPERAFLRLKMFTAYYARNFAFGQTLHTAVHSAPALAALHERAQRFFARPPQTVATPCFSGV